MRATCSCSRTLRERPTFGRRSTARSSTRSSPLSTSTSAGTRNERPPSLKPRRPSGSRSLPRPNHSARASLPTPHQWLRHHWCPRSLVPSRSLFYCRKRKRICLSTQLPPLARCYRCLEPSNLSHEHCRMRATHPCTHPPRCCFSNRCHNHSHQPTNLRPFPILSNNRLS